MIPLPDKKYSIIYADPPWPQQKGGLRKCRPRQGRALDYSTLPVEECLALQDQFLAEAAERHNVFLWAIDKYLHDIEAGMERRGYRLHARLVWDKGNGPAPAFTVRYSHEYLLWFFRPGRLLKPRPETRGKYTTVLREPAVRHSQKPECAYAMLEDMFPATHRAVRAVETPRMGRMGKRSPGTRRQKGGNRWTEQPGRLGARAMTPCSPRGRNAAG